MAKFLVDSMMDFEQEFSLPGAQASPVFVWFAKRTAIMEKWLARAVRWRELDDRVIGGCFFYWLALLPYDATHNVEAMIQCVLELIQKRIEAQKNETMKDLRHIESLELLITGLMTAVTGVPLINQAGRQAWLLMVNSILFTFEQQLKLRNPLRMLPWVSGDHLTNMRAFHRDDPPDEDHPNNAPMLKLRDNDYPSEISFMKWSKQLESDVAWMQYLSTPMWEADSIDKAKMLQYFRQHHRRINETLRRFFAHRPYHENQSENV